jgi:hypothetical protein
VSQAIALDFKNDDTACEDMTAACCDFIADVVRDCAPALHTAYDRWTKLRRRFFGISLVAERLTYLDQRPFP